MGNNQKWVKELSDFFVKDDNWEIACDTVCAVEQVESYWKGLFLEKVYQKSRELLDGNLWEVRKVDKEVDIYPRYGKHEFEESCCIIISYDDDDGCWYGIWIDSEGYKPSGKKKISEFSKEQGLEEGEYLFTRSQVAPYLDKAQLGKEAKNNFKDTEKIVTEAVKFMQDSNVRDVILGLRE